MTHARHHSYSKNPLIRISRDRRECPNYRECGHNNWTMLSTSPNLYPFLDVSDLSFAWWYARKSLFCELPGGGSIRAHRPAKPCTFPLGRSTQIFTSSLVSRPDHHVFWVRLWFLLRIRISWSAAVECAAIFPPELGEEFKLTESRPNLSELVRGFSHRTMQNLDGTRRRARINWKYELTVVELTTRANILTTSQHLDGVNIVTTSWGSFFHSLMVKKSLRGGSRVLKFISLNYIQAQSRLKET